MTHRYTAMLQRFDDAHVEIASGDDRTEVVTTARELYTALVPTILAQGLDHIKRSAKNATEDPDVQSKAKRTLELDWRVSEALRAREWGIGVYDRQSDDTANKLVFWVGASQEDPEL